MHLSRYLKIYPYEEKPGYLLLFSTKKTSKVLITEETYRAAKAGTLSDSDQKLLIKLGMLVPDRDVEKQEMLGFVDELNRRNTSLNITVVLNLDCNFACLYCYEGGIKGKLYMSDKTADSVIDFIKARLTNGKKFLNIDFYGGEPLLAVDTIKRITGTLKKQAETIGASFSFTLVTNGSLLTRNRVEELVPLGLKGVKITLDGPPENHNRYRPFKSGAGSFDVIIQNIKDSCDILKIGVGGNYDRNNYEQFTNLLDLLEAEGLTPDRLASVKFDPVMKHPEGEEAPSDYRDGCMSVNELWITEAEKLLRGAIIKKGYNTSSQRPSPCQIEFGEMHVINFDGRLYKCPAFIGKEGFDLGDIKTGMAGDINSVYRPGIWKNEEKCFDCEYLPLCFGGCRYMAYLQNGSLDKLDCKKEYLDRSLEISIKQDILNSPG